MPNDPRHKERHKSRGKQPMTLAEDGSVPADKIVIRVWIEQQQLIKLDRAEQLRALAGDRTVNRSQIIRELIDEKWPSPTDRGTPA